MRAFRITLLALLLGLLALPLALVGAQRALPEWPGWQNWRDSWKLSGFTDPEQPHVALNRTTWRSRGWQIFVERRIRSTTPGRELLIRAFNEAYFDIFDTSYMYSRVIHHGGEDNLFEAWYLAEACGPWNYESDAVVEDLADRIARLQRRLRAYHRYLLFAYTPSKARYLPQDLPPRWCPAGISPETQGSGSRLVEALKRRQVPVADARELVVKALATDPKPPFPKYGSHMSDPVNVRFAQAIINQLGSLAGSSLGTMEVEEVDWNVIPASHNRELFDLLNLWPAHQPHFVVGDPTVVCSNSTFAGSRDLLMVGGSFGSHLLIAMNRCPFFSRLDNYFYFDLNLQHLRDGTIDPVDVAHFPWERVLTQPGFLILEQNTAHELANEHLDKFTKGALAWLDAHPAK